MGERERERAESDSSFVNGNTSSDSRPSSPSAEEIAAQKGIDFLFDRSQEKSSWEPLPAPEVLGELLDSRHMLPLVLPSDPRMLGAIPGKRAGSEGRPVSAGLEGVRSASRASHGTRGSMAWRLYGRKLREIEIKTLQWVDGVPSTARWYRPIEFDEEDEKPPPPPYSPSDPNLSADGDVKLVTQFTPLTHSRSTRRSGRQSTTQTPIEPHENSIPPPLPEKS